MFSAAGWQASAGWVAVWVAVCEALTCPFSHLPLELQRCVATPLAFPNCFFLLSVSLAARFRKVSRSICLPRELITVSRALLMQVKLFKTASSNIPAVTILGAVYYHAYSALQLQLYLRVLGFEGISLPGTKRCQRLPGKPTTVVVSSEHEACPVVFE